jgi:hypothetical protein
VIGEELFWHVYDLRWKTRTTRATCDEYLFDCGLRLYFRWIEKFRQALYCVCGGLRRLQFPKELRKLVAEAMWDTRGEKEYFQEEFAE